MQKIYHMIAEVELSSDHYNYNRGMRRGRYLK